MLSSGSTLSSLHIHRSVLVIIYIFWQFYNTVWSLVAQEENPFNHTSTHVYVLCWNVESSMVPWTVQARRCLVWWWCSCCCRYWASSSIMSKVLHLFPSHTSLTWLIEVCRWFFPKSIKGMVTGEKQEVQTAILKTSSSNHSLQHCPVNYQNLCSICINVLYTSLSIK